MHKKSKITPSSRKQYTFKRVSENLYKVIETGGYYALVKRGGKQIRRSLKTNDKALAKRRLSAIKEKRPNSVSGRSTRRLPSRSTPSAGSKRKRRV